MKEKPPITSFQRIKITIQRYRIYSVPLPLTLLKDLSHLIDYKEERVKDTTDR